MSEKIQLSGAVIENKTLREIVYERLKTNIQEGFLLPGQVLPLNEIAKQLGTSIQPVREAIQLLVSEKILINENNRSVRVTQLTRNEYSELTEIRILLETHASIIGSQKRKESEMDEIKRSLVEMVDSEKSPKEYHLANVKFHFNLYKCSHSPILLETITGLWDRIRPYQAMHVLKCKDLVRDIEIHKKICSYFEKREFDLLRTALKEDLQKTKYELETYFKENDS